MSPPGIGDGDRVMPQPVVGWRYVRGWWGRLLSHICAGGKTRRKAAHMENKCARAEKKSTRRRLHCVNLTNMRVHRYMMAWNMAVSAQARPFSVRLRKGEIRVVRTGKSVNRKPEQ